MKDNRTLYLGLTLLLSLFLSPAALAQSDEDCKKAFTYDNGPLGQKHWCGECNLESSKRQAPINIETAKAERDLSLPVLDFDGYKPVKLMTSENFHNLKVDYKNGKSSIKIGDDSFKLTEFHFHRPGEEAINNRRTAMVIHLVHRNTDPGPIEVVTILVEEGRPAPKTDVLVNKLIKHFPLATGPQVLQDVEINAADLLPVGSVPKNHSYYRYEGSLTTPLCEQIVTFYVLKTPVRFSAEQLRQFEMRYPFPNSRNIQDTNGRKVEQTVR